VRRKDLHSNLPRQGIERKEKREEGLESILPQTISGLGQNLNLPREGKSYVPIDIERYTYLAVMVRAEGRRKNVIR